MREPRDYAEFRRALEGRFDSLSRGHKLVARHLLGDIERVAFMSVAELVAGAARLRSEGLIE